VGERQKIAHYTLCPEAAWVAVWLGMQLKVEKVEDATGIIYGMDIGCEAIA
jgi:hypothetical protein